ncbi:MAG: enoyl-CoA hydratase [Pseudomonadota bacterium]
MSDVIIEKSGKVVTATLNRPESRNALSDEMVRALDQMFTEGEHDAAVRCYVIRGQGEHFMAGGDVKKFYGNRSKPAAERRADTERSVHQLHLLAYKMRRAPQPIVASIRGAVAGFGMSLMMLADLAIAAEDAFFTLAYCHIGLSPDGSSTYTLPRIVGRRKAMELALLGERFGAQEALRLGLVNKVVPVASLPEETSKLAQRLAAGPARAYAHMKRLLESSIGSSLEAQLQAEGVAVADCMASNDLVEGVTAFVEKRPPRFTGA